MSYYDSDDDVCWGPYTVRELKRDIMQERHREGIESRGSISCNPTFLHDVKKRGETLNEELTDDTSHVSSPIVISDSEDFIDKISLILNENSCATGEYYTALNSPKEESETSRVTNVEDDERPIKISATISEGKHCSKSDTCECNATSRICQCSKNLSFDCLNKDQSHILHTRKAAETTDNFYSVENEISALAESTKYLSVYSASSVSERREDDKERRPLQDNFVDNKSRLDLHSKTIQGNKEANSGLRVPNSSYFSTCSHNNNIQDTSEDYPPSYFDSLNSLSTNLSGSNDAKSTSSATDSEHIGKHYICESGGENCLGRCSNYGTPESSNKERSYEMLGICKTAEGKDMPDFTGSEILDDILSKNVPSASEDCADENLDSLDLLGNKVQISDVTDSHLSAASYFSNYSHHSDHDRDDEDFLCEDDLHTSEIKFNDTLEEMEKLLNEGINYSMEEVKLPNTPHMQGNLNDFKELKLPQTSTSKTVSLLPVPTSKKHTKPYDYIISPVSRYISTPSANTATKFKVPENPARNKTSPLPISSGSKNLFKNIKSPISVYIKNSPMVPFYKTITPKKCDQKILCEKKFSEEANKVSVDVDFPEVIYKRAKRTVVTNTETLKLPNNIESLISSRKNIVINHFERTKSSKKDSVGRRLLEEDVDMSKTEDSLLNNSSKDISFYVTQRAFIN